MFFQNSHSFASGSASNVQSLATSNVGDFYTEGYLSNITAPTIRCVSRQVNTGLRLDIQWVQLDRAPTLTGTASGTTLTI